MNSEISGISRNSRFLLLSSVFIVAACGLVYELIAGAVSSYILGDAVTQFSLVIGVFLCSMGFGSYLSKFIKNKLLYVFIEIEIIIGLVGGCSSIIMFAISALISPLFTILFYTLCCLIGILIGLEIPILIRIFKETESVSEAVSHVLAIDYIGALAGSILFPIFALPFLGISRSSVVFGILNLLVAAGGITLLPKPKKWISIRCAIVALVLIISFIYSSYLIHFFEDMLYDDNVIYAKSTHYQRIVMTRWRDDIRLYLNGSLQFCSIDEYRYHESLVIPPMETCHECENVLILGGGDGMAAREVLKYKNVKDITLVDLDPQMTHLGQRRPELTRLNQNSLNSPLVKIINMDAMNYLNETDHFYDLIIVDLPDPNSEILSKLYSTAFYTLCFHHLSKRGILVTQATSPFYAPKAFWCIYETIKSIKPPVGSGFYPIPYHVNIPSFGEWGFIMAGKTKIQVNKFKISVPTRFLSEPIMLNMFNFPKDMVNPDNLEKNQLNFPVIYRYYQRGWDKFNQ